MPQRILALNPWHGGSHQAFLEEWIRHSQHEFTVLPLPPYKWKWRMRHSAVTFSRQLDEMLAGGSSHQPAWDVLFCTDMLGLAEFRGLCPKAVHALPTVAYFHENQLTYPNQKNEERDFHFAYSNLTTALAADRVWFNSAFHRDEFLSAMRDLLQRMPDFGHVDSIDRILARSAIQHPGIEAPERTTGRDEVNVNERVPGPLRIVWASRWEHDKNPELFFDAISELSQCGVPFELSVLGESFRHSPPCFDSARQQFSDNIRHWGFATDRADYFRVLAESDVVVSTARHEFFGISVLEAVAAGCRPLVPRALAYPETLGSNQEFFHNETAAGIAARLSEMSEQLAVTSNSNIAAVTDRFHWNVRAGELDLAIEELCSAS